LFLLKNPVIARSILPRTLARRMARLHRQSTRLKEVYTSRPCRHVRKTRATREERFEDG
jgi:hypothetical protein